MGFNPKSGKGKSKRKPFPKKKDDKFEDSRSNNSQSSKGRRNDDRGYSAKMDDRDTMVKSGYSNDPRWYDKCGILTKDATNISTLNPTGIPLECGIVGNYTPSGIMRLDYIPHFGDINDRTHPLNVVARQLYDYVNARNSRSSSYDPTDLMFYCIGVANAWSVHSWILRAVGMFNTFSRSNYYWWDPVMETMGIAPVSTTNSINAWASLANYIALTLNTLAVPKGISYFQRVQMLPSSVYVDSKSDKGSLYYFNPKQLLKYEYDDEGKSRLRGVNAPWVTAQTQQTRGVTPDVIRAWFDDFVANLLNDSDITFMKADIRKAFGDENTFMLPQISDTFQHAFVYDDYVNVQVHNATVHTYLGVSGSYHYELQQNMTNNSIISNSTAQWVTANKEAMVSTPSFVWYSSPFNGDHLFDFPTDEVPNDLWSEATKLHSYWTGKGLQATTEVLVADYYWSIVVHDDHSTSLDRATACTMIGLNPQNWAGQTADSIKSAVTGVALKLDNISKFAYSPLYYLVFTGNTGTYNPPGKVYVVDDLTNYTTVSSTTLDKVRIPAQLSLFTAFEVK
uniref:Capsid protein n=1 Tax=Dromedary picobirnavirus TaxID=1574421 RepID=A0A0A1EKX5_9VIRU|nr:capsid protein [Dromedary picobirnavirus]